MVAMDGSDVQSRLSNLDAASLGVQSRLTVLESTVVDNFKSFKNLHRLAQRLECRIFILEFPQARPLEHEDAGARRVAEEAASARPGPSTEPSPPATTSCRKCSPG